MARLPRLDWTPQAGDNREMPFPVTAYRIFIASPSGLDDERRRFRDTINEYNESDALERGVLFIPVGWELTLPGLGRPQELINQDLRRCDYCHLVLHDRWGSPSSTTPPFTSGTEEEYVLVRSLIADGTMRNLVVSFRNVPDERLANPDPQLQQVLDFRVRLEAEKALLFSTYLDLADFERRLRRNLGAWLRDHERRNGVPK
jgi:hypothetical protein